MSRAHREKRKSPSKAAIDHMLRHYGLCAICEKRLSGYYEADHIVPLWKGKELGGTNEPENFRPLCAECHRKETTSAAPERAEVRNLAQETGQVARRNNRGSSLKGRSDFPPGQNTFQRIKENHENWPSRKIRSRGFQDRNPGSS